jgi:hypothetical protein
MTSDIDLVVLTDDRDSYLTGTDWIEPAAGQAGRIVRTQAWGPVMERRVELPSGFLVEFGFAPTEWACVDPLDPENARVVADGFEVLYDPDELLHRLVLAVASRER